MSTTGNLRTLRLLAIAAAAASIASGTAAARVDPGDGMSRPAPSGIAPADPADRVRPTGLDPDGRPGASPVEAPPRTAPRRPESPQSAPPVAIAVAPDTGFDWLAAGIGALTALGALGLAAAGVVILRRGSRVRGAV